MSLLQFDQPNLLPDENNENILKALSLLGIPGKPLYIDIVADEDANLAECFINVIKKLRFQKEK